MSFGHNQSVGRRRVGVFPGHKTIEPLLESRQTSTPVDEVLSSAGPRRMRGWVDFEGELGARLPEGRARLESRAVIHNDGNLMVIGMDVFFHG